MKNKIITISREFSSGGRTVGKELAGKLGIPCYDADLIQKIAEESGFDKNYAQIEKLQKHDGGIRGRTRPARDIQLAGRITNPYQSIPPVFMN